MRKSPLSTPRDVNNFHRGRGQRRGYVYGQTRNDNENYQRFSGFNNSPNNPFEGDMIPLSTSSPKPFHQNVNERQQSNDGGNQRFSSTGISSSYNQRDNYQNNPRGRGRKPQQGHANWRNTNWRQDNDTSSNGTLQYRKFPINEIFDIKNASENPWEELERQLEMEKSDPQKKAINDSSVEIISERFGNADSSPDCSADEATINISSSYDETKQDSSVDLPLESMHFSQTSSDVIILSDNLTSQSDNSLNESGN